MFKFSQVIATIFAFFMAQYAMADFKIPGTDFTIDPNDPLDIVPDRFQPKLPDPKRPLEPPLPFPGPNPQDVVDDCLADLSACPQRTLDRIASSDRELIAACFAQPFKCPENVVKRIPARALKDIIFEYKDDLMSQVDEYESLPNWFIDEFQESYPTINLRNVVYATGIDTIHGAAITFYYSIFFPQDEIDLFERFDRDLMLHELQHTAQYKAKGGEDAFISEYVLTSAGTIVENKSFDVHDQVPTEQDANNKSAQIGSNYGWNITLSNYCDFDIYVGVNYLDIIQNEYLDTGWITITRDENIVLYNNNQQPIHTLGKYIYIYAENEDKSLIWYGEYSGTIDGQDYPLMEISMRSEDQKINVNFRCPE